MLSKILTGIPIGKRPLGSPRRRWDSIRMDHKEMSINTRNWVELRIGFVGEPL